MRIATLQFTPTFGAVVSSIASAEAILESSILNGQLEDLDLLVLPELAFTGYNFPNKDAIARVLEMRGGGPSTRWAMQTARKLRCTVAVGYPELGKTSTNHDKFLAYNSLVFVDASGDIAAHYRKSHLYYTDETWAEEGEEGFLLCDLPLRGTRRIKAAGGICMDINPYRFEAPWGEYEFSSHVRRCGAALVVVSMAWLTRLSDLELELEQEKPDLATLQYWIERFTPLLTQKVDSVHQEGEIEQKTKADAKNGAGAGAIDEKAGESHEEDGEREVVVVFANRTGDEGLAPRIGEVRYAGSSCVVGMKRDGRVRLWNILGRAKEGMCVVDTEREAQFALKLAPMPS